MEQPPEQLQIVVFTQLRPVIRLDSRSRVLREDRDPLIGARTNRTPGPQADRRVQRLRALVEQVQRPDVERSAREVDACWCRRFDQHSDTYNSLRMISKDLRKHAGQLSIAGFTGHSIPADLKILAREFDLGGIILFARNVDSPEQVAEIAREAQSLTQELPLWVSVDQEGGRVARLKTPFTVWPPMMTLGRSGDAQLAARFARALAAELRAVGISMDYTPVLDILTNASNPVIGDRALATDAEQVAKLGQVIIRTLQENGIAACGKHFPGHGDTSVDSHFELPLIEHPPDRIERVELVPFRAAIEAGVASIMTAHILIPALDTERPATLSRRVVTTMLKQELGYEGLVLSDDLEIKAISGRYGM